MPTYAQTITNGLALCDNHYRHRWHIRYSQARPTQLRWPKFVTRQDCSGLVSNIMWRLNVMPDVNWYYQNTWSLIKLGQPVNTKALAKPMDIVFYGPTANNPIHVAIYTGNGQVLSNGSYPMRRLPIDYRRDRIAIRRYIGTDPNT